MNGLISASLEDIPHISLWCAVHHVRGLAHHACSGTCDNSDHGKRFCPETCQCPDHDTPCNPEERVKAII